MMFRDTFEVEGAVTGESVAVESPQLVRVEMETNGMFVRVTNGMSYPERQPVLTPAGWGQVAAAAARLVQEANSASARAGAALQPGEHYAEGVLSVRICRCADGKHESA